MSLNLSIEPTLSFHPRHVVQHLPETNRPHMMFREQPYPPKLDSQHRKNTDRPPATTVVISDSSESSDGSDSDDQEWPIKCILRETDTEYLIDWEGPYDPTWVSVFGISGHKRHERNVLRACANICACFACLGTQRERERACYTGLEQAESSATKRA